MEIMHIEVKVKPGCQEAFAEATRVAAEASRAEPGNLRFDVVQSLTDETIFLMLEVYADSSAKEAHFKTEHFAAWQNAIGDLLEDTSMKGCRPISPAIGDW